MTPADNAAVAIARRYAEKIYPVAGQMYETLGLQLCDRLTAAECRNGAIDECAALIQQAAAEMVKETGAEQALVAAGKDQSRLFTDLPITGPLPCPSAMQHVSYALARLRALQKE